MKTGKSFSIKFALLSLLMLFSASVRAQVKVTGTVIDEAGEAVLGATVREKGTQSGAATDINGNFTINVKSANATLSISYVGYQTETVSLAGRTNVKVTLKAKRNVRFNIKATDGIIVDKHLNTVKF